MSFKSKDGGDNGLNKAPNKKMEGGGLNHGNNAPKEVSGLNLDIDAPQVDMPDVDFEDDAEEGI